MSERRASPAGILDARARRAWISALNARIRVYTCIVSIYSFIIGRSFSSRSPASPARSFARSLLTLETKNVSKRSTSHSFGRHRDARRLEIVKMYHVRSVRRFCVHARVRVDVGRRICPGRFQFVTLEKCSRRNRRDERRRRGPRGRSRGSRSRGLG